MADGAFSPTDVALIGKMRDALAGTLTGTAKDKATGASKSSSSTSKKKRGRPTDTDHAADRRIYDAWKTGQHLTKEDLARALNRPIREIKLALDRERKRRKK